MSRKIEDLTTAMQSLAFLFAGAMAEAGVPFIFTSTRRTQAEQDALYAKGRTAPGPKVTWTRKSRHIDGEAFDIAILNDGQPTWDMKVNVNENDVGDYYEAGQLGESVGLKWGGRFTNQKGESCPDYPHFELA
jgi:peptidoglycan L-alanyl-D-glutamate endopeptidase CwlK